MSVTQKLQTEGEQYEEILARIPDVSEKLNAESLVTPYEDLTYPVNVGTYTFYNEKVYEANTYIPINYGDFNPQWWSEVSNIIDTKANKANPVFTGSISLGRYSASTTGDRSIAVGIYASASGRCSAAFGDTCTASGEGALASGLYAKASGSTATAHGANTTASGANSFALGINTIAKCQSQIACGQYNIADPDYSASGVKGRYIEIVGNGTGTSARKNARVLSWTGDERLKGDLYVGCNDDSTGGTKVAKITDIPAIPVTDVQVNGVSIISSGVANILVATTTETKAIITDYEEATA